MPLEYLEMTTYATQEVILSIYFLKFQIFKFWKIYKKWPIFGFFAKVKIWRAKVNFGQNRQNNPPPHPNISWTVIGTDDPKPDLYSGENSTKQSQMMYFTAEKKSPWNQIN